MNPFPSLLRRFRLLSLRSKAIGVFFATSLVTRVIGIICQLVQVPIAVHALGAEAFGLWMTLTSISFVIIFADFGVGQGAQNKLAEAFATGERRAIGELTGTALIFMGVMGAFFSAVVAVACRQIDFASLFHLTDAGVRAEAAHAVEVSLLLCCANFPLGFAQRLAYARQEGWSHNLAQGLGAAGSLAGALLAAAGHWSLTGFIAAAQLPVVLSNGLLLVWLLVRTARDGGLRLRCRGTTMRDLFRLGAYFGIQQVHITLLLALPQALISMVLGASAVTPYNLTQRLFNLFAIVQNAFMLPLWPAYSDAWARGDFAWIRRTLRLSLFATLGCTILPMALGAVLARPAIALWLGRRAVVLPEPGLVWLLFFWNAAVFIEQPFGYLLAGLSQVRKVTRFSIIGGLASAILMYVGVCRFGPEGLVLGMLLGFLPYLFCGAVAETARVWRTMPRPGPAEAAPLLPESWKSTLSRGGRP